MQFSNLLTIASIVGVISATGLNCKGSSSFCGSALCNTDVSAGNCMQQLAVGVKAIPDATHFADKAQLACVYTSNLSGGICAFYQNTGSTGGNASLAKTMMQDLVNADCKICGSAPTEGTDISNGELTVNYVGNPNPPADPSATPGAVPPPAFPQEPVGEFPG